MRKSLDRENEDDGKILGYRWESDMALHKRSYVFSSVDHLSGKGRNYLEDHLKLRVQSL